MLPNVTRAGRTLPKALQPKGRRGETLRVVNATKGEADIYLYEEIGFWGVTASEFARELREITASRINLHISSPGGEVFDGVAIYTALQNHPASVTVYIDGLAASAASFIAMAGDRIIIAKHASMMIHDPWGITLGDARDHRKQADLLDQLGDTLAAIYAERAGGSVREWRDLMLAETWYTDREAVEAGLADEVAGDEAQPVDRFDLSIFRNTPDHLRRQPPRDEGQSLTKREAERALRDAGMSAAAAKALIASGWNGLEDDARDERDMDELLAFIKQATPTRSHP